MEISRIVESAWLVGHSALQAKAMLEGLLGPAETEGMRVTAPTYIRQLELAIKTAPHAKDAKEHLRLMKESS